MLVRKVAASVVVVIILLIQIQAQGTSAHLSSGRAIASRVAPAYPELARKMHIHGTVKVEAGVRPNGTVKSTRIMGGNPVLIEAASDAVKQWKFAPGPAETIEVVQVSFEAQ
jgi:TonB family protein